MKTKLTFIMALPILFSLSCEGKSDVEKFADDYCAQVSKCCGQQGLPSDGKTCRMLLSLQPGYNVSAGKACLAEMRTQVSAGTFCQSTTSPQSLCASVYSGADGNSKPGEACTTSDDCAKPSEGQVVCTGTSVNGQYERKCQVRVAGKVGEACIGTQDDDTYVGDVSDDFPVRATVCNIAHGLRCVEAVCVALTEVGGSCYSSSDCVRSA